MQAMENREHPTPAPGGAEPEPSFVRRTVRVIGYTLLGAAVAIPAICLYLGRKALTGKRSAEKPSSADVPSRPAVPIPITLDPVPQQVEVAAKFRAAADEPAAVPVHPAAPVPPYVASTESDKFHVPSCRWARQIQAQHRVTFGDREDAVAQGYTPCGSCSP